MKRLTRQYNKIPVALSPEDFNTFFLPHLSRGKSGPKKKLSFYKLFNYILKLIYTGCQWSEIPISKDEFGRPKIHYTNIFRAFQLWLKAECFDKVFESSVARLFKQNMLDTSIIHGDGTSTAAKKGVII